MPNDHACEVCLLLHLLERVSQMPTTDDLNNALAAQAAAISSGFSGLGATIATETSTILAALANAPVQIPQATIDAITASTANINAGFAAASAAVSAELPSATT